MPSYYSVSNQADFEYAINNTPFGDTADIQLTSNINLNSTWPFSTTDVQLVAIIDGNGYNFNTKLPLFRSILAGSEFNNVKIEFTYLDNTPEIGAFLCNQTEQVSFNDCTVTGEIATAGHTIGGYCGRVGKAAFSNCTFRGNIAASGVTGRDGLVGGFVGRAGNDCSFTSCTSSGKVTGEGHYVGGITGLSNWNTFESCSANVEVYSSLNNTGCIAGASQFCRITGCESFGSASSGLTTGERVGGICGMSYYSCVVDCYNHAKIKTMDDGGGICGRALGTLVARCANNGVVTSQDTDADSTLLPYISLGGQSHYGGIVGSVMTNPPPSITALDNVTSSVVSQCATEANVTAFVNAGGVVGHVYHLPTTFSTAGKETTPVRILGNWVCDNGNILAVEQAAGGVLGGVWEVDEPIDIALIENRVAARTIKAEDYVYRITGEYFTGLDGVRDPIPDRFPILSDNLAKEITQLSGRNYDVDYINDTVKLTDRWYGHDNAHGETRFGCEDIPSSKMRDCLRCEKDGSDCPGGEAPLPTPGSSSKYKPACTNNPAWANLGYGASGSMLGIGLLNCGVRGNKGRVNILHFMSPLAQIPVADAGFQVRDMDANVVQSLVTGENGELILCNLEPGQYRLVPNIIPDGWLPQVYQITVDDNGKVTVNGYTGLDIFINANPAFFEQYNDSSSSSMSACSDLIRKRRVVKRAPKPSRTSRGLSAAAKRMDSKIRAAGSKVYRSTRRSRNLLTDIKPPQLKGRIGAVGTGSARKSGAKRKGSAANRTQHAHKTQPSKRKNRP